MIISDKEYYEQIKSLFSDLSNGHPVKEMFNKFEHILETYLTAELGHPFPSQDLSPEEIIDRSLNGTLNEEIQKKDKPLNLAFVPVGPFTRSLVEGLSKNNIQVTALFDNYKSDLFKGLKICHPDHVCDFDFDKIIVTTPDGNLQRILKKQLLDILPECDHEKIVLYGDVHRLDRLSYTRTDMDSNILNQVKRFNKIKEKKDKESIVIAMKVFPTHYVQILKELKRRGHAVALIVNNPELGYGSTIFDICEYADLTYCCNNNYLEFLTLLSKIQGDILLSSDHLYDNPLMLMVRVLWKGKMFHEVYDLNDNMEFDLGVGQEQFREGWGYDFQPLDNYSRKALYQAVDGILYRESPALAKKMVDFYSLETPVMRFVPYPDQDEKYSLYTDEIHMVFCGPIPYLGKEVMAVCTLPRVAEDLARQHIHLHFYNPADPDRTVHKPLIDLDERNPYVRYFQPVSYSKLRQTLRPYDWGSMIYYIPEGDIYVERYKDAFSSMFLSYLSAELPIVCTDNIAFMADLVKKHKIGIVIKSEDIKSLSNILNDCDKNQLVENVKNLNKKWNIQAQYEPLISFFRSSRETNNSIENVTYRS